MPNFVISYRPPLRFTGDFQLAPNSGYQPTDAEKSYHDAVNAVIELMATDAAADTGARYSEQLLLARQAERKRRATELEADARKFVAGYNAAGDLARVTAIRDEYLSRIPKFGTKDASPPRFDGDFALVFVADYIPSAADQVFLDHVTQALDELAVDKRGDLTGDFSQGIIDFRKNQRRVTATALREQVADFWTGETTSLAAAEKVVLTRGRYQALRDRLKRRLFNVKLTSEKKAEDADAISILDIKLVGGLPPPQDAPSTEKQELYVQINKANTVVMAVCARITERAQRGLMAWFGYPNKKALNRARILQEEFLSQLHGIAWIGLELEFTALAKLGLAELRNQFFVLQAGQIKNTYVRQLGAWAGLAGLVFIAAYVAVTTRDAQWPWGYDHRNFLLAGCGAAAGTWASFSVRQVQFSFDDLVMLEESSLDPPLRVLFVFVLTMVVCLLFWNNAINIEIGNLKTNPGAFRQQGSVALLIGLFAGLSERTLATAISGRAAAFVRGVAGSS
jgi:hypothetical protein